MWRRTTALYDAILATNTTASTLAERARWTRAPRTHGVCSGSTPLYVYAIQSYTTIGSENVSYVN